MKKFLISIGILLISFSASADFVSPLNFNDSQKQEVVDFVRLNAENKWGDDYRMVKHEFDKQMTSFKWLLQNATNTEILAGAIRKWSNDGDYRMIQHEYNKQSHALSWLKVHASDEKIFKSASRKWGKDYIMVKHEYEKQLNSKNADFDW